MDNISVGVPAADGLLKKGTQDWIEKCLKSAQEKGANVVVVMHHNMLNHSEVIREGFTLNNSGQALILLKDYQVNLVLSGHIHVQDITSDLKSPGPLYDIASGALSVYPHLYGVLNYSAEDNTLNYHTQSVDVDSWAKIKHIKDRNLLNFSKYSKDYFGKVSYNRTYKSLIDSDYTKEQAELMADTIRTLNLRYFSGTENLNANDVKNSEGYKLWLDSPDSFRKFYIESILSDNDTDDNRLTIKLPQVTKAPVN
jgi:3',5'-cyclic AMP phosphodiesterase CpdA